MKRGINSGVSFVKKLERVIKIELKIYVANLGKYTEGELVGAWFNLPADFDEIKEKIGLNAEYEGYAIHDYELPFEISEYESIEKLNNIVEQIESLEDSNLVKELKAVAEAFFGSGLQGIEELSDHADDIHCYTDCENMTDVAHYFIDETGALKGMEENLQGYFDYAAYGRDLRFSGRFVETSNGVFEYTR